MSKKDTPVTFGGVYAALVTPRRPDTIEADAAAYLDYLDRVAAAGVDGLVFFGSTGEFVHFEAEERMRLVGLAVKRSRVPVLVNVSHSTFSGARDLADHAMNAGAHGLLLMPPYFYRYDDAEVQHFYEEFSTAVDNSTPLFLYNLPQSTTPLSPAVMDRLLSSGLFAGIKDSSGDWPQCERLLQLRAQHPFTLFAGHEGIYARSLQAGTDGVVSGIAAALPELPVAMKRARQKDNVEVLAQLDGRIAEFLDWISQFPTTVAIKEAADARGWVRNAVATPLHPATAGNLLRFRAWFSAWLPQTLALCTSVRP